MPLARALLLDLLWQQKMLEVFHKGPHILQAVWGDDVWPQRSRQLGIFMHSRHTSFWIQFLENIARQLPVNVPSTLLAAKNKRRSSPGMTCNGRQGLVNTSPEAMPRR